MKIKALIIFCVFVACLTILLLIRKTESRALAVHHVDFYGQNSSLSSVVSLKEIIYVDGKSGDIVCLPCSTLFPFNEMVLCWNCRNNDSSGLAITISVSHDGKQWYEFPYQKWGFLGNNAPAASDSAKIACIGFVDTDVLKLETPMQFYKFDVRSYPNDKLPFYLSGSLSRISVCYSNTQAGASFYSRYSPKIQKLKYTALAVPFTAQGSLPDSISARTCSPTSLTMVLNYYGLDYSAMQVSAAVYDPYSKIYGNWPYNMEAAYLLGLKKTWIGRHNSFSEIADEIYQGRPVIISIDVPKGKLAGAPYNATGGGHLIVVRGFDGKGKVLVNDPAGDNPAEGIVAYDLKELTAVWVGHGGVAYHLWPEP